MATFEDVVIRVTERGAKETANSIGGIGKAAENTAGAVASLNRIMYSLLGAFSVKTLIDYTDKFQAMGNQLKLVTKNTEELTKTQERLFSMANNNRVGVSELTELYSKLAMSQKEVGVSGEQLWRVTDVISKSIAVAGKSGQAGANGLRQFIQGLVSGKVQGEELRSVLENTPYLAKTLADGLRVPVGALRELGAQGKLTSQTVVNALLNMQKQVDKDFAKTSVTVSQALTILDNAFTRFIGQSGSASGASKILSEGIVFLAMNLDKVAMGLIAATAAWVGYRIAVAAVAAAQWLANAAIAANPIVRLVTILATGTALLITFAGGWGTVVDMATKAGVAIWEAFKSVSTGVSAAITWLSEFSASAASAADSFTSAFGNGVEAVTGFFKSWATWLGELVTVTLPGYFTTAIDFIKQAFVNGFTAVKDFFVNLFNGLKKIIDDFVQGSLNFINRVVAAAQTAARALSNLTSGKSSSSNSNSNSNIDGARASGGPVKMGKTYLVGENGPELFSPGSNGSIIPNGGQGAAQSLQASTRSYDASRSQRMLEDSLQAALGEHFQSLRAIGNETNLKLDKLIELSSQTATATSSLNSTVETAAANGSTKSGTSAINNFGIDGVNTGTTVAPPSSYPSYSGGGAGGGASTGGGGGAQANLNVSYWVNQLSKALVDNFTGLRSGANNRVPGIKSQIPSEILDEVVKKAQLKAFGSQMNSTISFRTGGQFTVPGGTGVDSKVIPIRASPGEEVNVRTRKQVREEQGSREVVGGNTYQFNVYAQDANSFRQSETQIMREFLRKASAATRN